VASELATLVSGIRYDCAMSGNNAPKPPSNRAAALRSEMSAGSTPHAMSSPKVSTGMWRLRVEAANAATFRRLVVFTDWPSMMTTSYESEQVWGAKPLEKEESVSVVPENSV
jgi:hypothetical protein